MREYTTPAGTTTPTPSPVCFNPYAVRAFYSAPVVLSPAHAARLSFLLSHAAQFLALEADPLPGEHTTLDARFITEAHYLAVLLRPVPMTDAEQVHEAMQGRR